MGKTKDIKEMLKRIEERKENLLAEGGNDSKSAYYSICEAHGYETFITELNGILYKWKAVKRLKDKLKIAEEINEKTITLEKFK